MEKTFDMVVAVEENHGIGTKGTLPWKIKHDMNYFKTITTAAENGKINAVIMGRKTYESIPEKFRPLPGRLNIVITSQIHSELKDNPAYASSLKDALDIAWSKDDIGTVFVIGGAQVYRDAIKLPECRMLHITQIFANFEECDVFFPEFEELFEFSRVDGSLRKENDVCFQYEKWTRKALVSTDYD